LLQNQKLKKHYNKKNKKIKEKSNSKEKIDDIKDYLKRTKYLSIIEKLHFQMS
jgi:hypothetical protein